MNEFLEVFLSLCIGFGLASACGFRVFVPMLITSLAAKTGHLELSESFAWIGTDAALATFAVATAAEVFAYSIPWFDNLLDSIATPCSVIAGSILMANFIPAVDPWLKWSLAIIAGGLAAGGVQTVTAMVRGASSVATGGLGNPLVSTGEAVASTGLSALAILVPLLAVVAVVAVVGLVGVTGFAGWKVVSRKAPALEAGQALPPNLAA